MNRGGKMLTTRALGFFYLLMVPAMLAQTVRQPASLQPVISRTPFWPPDGAVPPELADHYFVFLDYGAQEYVVSYPDPADAISGGAKRIQFRVEAQFAVAPEVSVTISKRPAGLTLYSYTVKNGPSAKRPIQEFGVIAAAEDDSVTLTHSAWAASRADISRPQESELRDPQGPALKFRAGAGRLVSWRGSAATEIPQSGVGTGFQLMSRYLPGITLGLASSGVVAKVPVELPPDVEVQLRTALSPETNWAQVITIGPKFNPDDGPAKDPVWIASDYRMAIEKLRHGGQLAFDSPFVAELITLLDVVSQGGQRVPFRYQKEPMSAMEVAIGAAARMALSSE